MRGGPEFTRSLSGGMKAPKVVGLALVENVRVPGGIMPSKRVEGENPLSPDFKGFGVRCRVGPSVAWLLWSPATTAIARHLGSPWGLCGVTHSKV
jgi:hypothetical protein